MKPDEKTTTILIRVTKDEKDLIEMNADIYANGNLSAWVRLAALKYEPE